MPTISAVNYRKVIVPVETETEYFLSPFDVTGKPLEFMTVEVDSTNATAILYLPQISNFGGVFNTKIIVSSLPQIESNQTIYVRSLEGDFIGGINQINIVPLGNVVFTPVTTTEWSAVQTPGSIPA